MMELREKIEQVIAEEPVALFMKGTPQRVMCGNSLRALEALHRAGAPVTAVDILPDPRIRQELSALSGWPTIPQVFIGSELIGGADITEELAESGGARGEARVRARRGLPERSRLEAAHASGSAEVGPRRSPRLAGRLDKVAALLEEAGARRRALFGSEPESTYY